MRCFLQMRTVSMGVIGTLLSLSVMQWDARSLSAADDDVAKREFFETKIRPVLVQHCYACHSDQAAKAGKLKGGLKLDSSEAARRGGETGPAVVPGDVKRSLLISALRHESLEMPPSGKLKDEVIADFVRWIETGAVDPRDGSTTPNVAIDFEAARRSHWSFQLPQKPNVPVVENAAWSRQDIDRFVFARLKAMQLMPVSPAHRRDLVRRVYFGLTGLPPTAEDIETFLNDESPTALETVVNRLLDSPAYGERWARHWLDIARYADDQALANAKDNPHAYRYRDWVVRALQEDMPYDRFLKLQLAGDLLPEPVDDYFMRLAGLGYQGLGQLYHRGNFPEQVMADELDDRIDTVSRSLLGLTVACARCHDHKYDPIPTRDYYSLAAAYQGSDLFEMPLAAPEAVEAHKQFTSETKRRETQIAQWVTQQGQSLSRRAAANLKSYFVAAWQIQVRRANQQTVDDKALATELKLDAYFLTRTLKLLDAAEPGKNREPLATWHQAAREAVKNTRLEAQNTQPSLPEPFLKLTDEIAQQAVALIAELERIDADFEQARSAAKSDEERKKVARAELSADGKRWSAALLAEGTGLFAINGGEVLPLLDATGQAEHQAQQTALAEFKKSAPPAPSLAHGVRGGGTPMRINIRGNVERKGDLAPPGFLQVLKLNESDTAGTKPASDVKPDSKPATFSRLDLANAIATSQNPLTARVIVNRVWHHHFGRGLVATPSNFGTQGEAPSHPELLDYLAVEFMEHGWSLKWLHRQIVLSATYGLAATNNPQQSAQDADNKYLWRWTPRRLDFESWRDAVLVVTGQLDRTLGGPSQSLESHRRRTLYSKISRSKLDGTLAAFDFPDANVSNEKRTSTMVAQQQLFVMNSPFMIDAAKAFAERIEKHSADEGARLTMAYRWAFGREPTEAERNFGTKYLQSAAMKPDDQLSPWARYAQALLASNEFTWVP